MKGVLRFCRNGKVGFLVCKRCAVFPGKGRTTPKAIQRSSGLAPRFQNLGYWLGFPWAGSARSLGSGTLTDRRALQPCQAMEVAPQRAWHAGSRAQEDYSGALRSVQVALLDFERGHLCLPSIVPSGDGHVTHLGHGLTTPADTSPVGTLGLGFGLQNREEISFCCLSPSPRPRPWYLVMAAQAHNTDFYLFHSL